MGSQFSWMFFFKSSQSGMQPKLRHHCLLQWILLQKVNRTNTHLVWVVSTCFVEWVGRKSWVMSETHHQVALWALDVQIVWQHMVFTM